MGVWALVIVGIAAGAVVMAAAARSVGEPLAAMRDALARVQLEDFEAEVAVDDGGEVGLLEAGFNRMVTGLRERRELEDLFGRHVGAAQRYEYTLIGDPVNEAARLTDHAKARLGRILASEEAIARAGDREASHWVVADELALRGRRQPTLAYEPLADTLHTTPRLSSTGRPEREPLD